MEVAAFLAAFRPNFMLHGSHFIFGRLLLHREQPTKTRPSKVLIFQVLSDLLCRTRLMAFTSYSQFCNSALCLHNTHHLFIRPSLAFHELLCNAIILFKFWKIRTLNGFPRSSPPLSCWVRILLIRLLLRQRQQQGDIYFFSILCERIVV